MHRLVFNAKVAAEMVKDEGTVSQQATSTKVISCRPKRERSRRRGRGFGLIFRQMHHAGIDGQISVTR